MYNYTVYLSEYYVNQTSIFFVLLISSLNFFLLTLYFEFSSLYWILAVNNTLVFLNQAENVDFTQVTYIFTINQLYDFKRSRELIFNSIIASILNIFIITLNKTCLLNDTSLRKGKKNVNSSQCFFCYNFK